MPKGSALLVAALENEGVEHIFGIPGEENLDVVESLRTSKIELVLTRHEQAAAFMAATQGRLTGRPGVCLSTLGPGALNFTTGAAYAHLGAMPMLMITGQKPIKRARQGRFQVVDIVGAMRPLTSSNADRLGFLSGELGIMMSRSRKAVAWHVDLSPGWQQQTKAPSSVWSRASIRAGSSKLWRRRGLQRSGSGGFPRIK